METKEVRIVYDAPERREAHAERELWNSPRI
jgi:hypothetical protein